MHERTMGPQRPAVLLLSAMLAAVGCRSDAGGPDTARGEQPTEGQERPMRDYDGPPLAAELEVMESMPVQYAVSVKVTAPSGGYELRHDETVRQADTTVVRCTLTEPGPDEMAMTVITEVDERVELGTDIGARVRIDVRRVKRGVKADPPPDYATAKTLIRP